MARRIDAHQHYWKVDRGDYHWMPALGPLRHDYLPHDLAPCNAAAGIDGTILVQAAQTIQETEFLLNIATQPESAVLGVVGWVPLDSDRAAADLERLASHPKAVGVRPMLHDLPEKDWIEQRAVIENMRRAAQLDLRFDVLAYPEHLPHALHAIDQVPDLDVVIDHLSKPRFGPILQEAWRHWMAEFAKRPRTCCKLSGMVTEVGAGWTIDDFRAHVTFIFDAFGPERIMFGSDWPVCLQVASHAEVCRLAEELTVDLTAAGHDAVWGQSAARFYGV